jgi:hypothetical protein
LERVGEDLPVAVVVGDEVVALGQSVPAPGVATGFDGAAALTAMPSSYSSAARLFVSRFKAAFTVP